MAYRQKKKENRNGGFWQRLLVLGHFCCMPHLSMHYGKSKDYNFTIYSIELEKIL